ncbi:tetratricopeptide repeat protein, partial [Nonomuraea sp. NPDC049709]|uniref:tetratricopeptide repeat protein n=1 Tax=Nonomuraea sp. NPDC049709 TaxID=3154736 RepID=UPI00341D03CF
AAARAMPDGDAHSKAVALAMECAHAWQRTRETAAADAALSLVVAAGQPEDRQRAGCFLGALRGDAGDRRGAVAVFMGALGEDGHLNGVALRSAGQILRELGEHAEAVEVLSRALSQTHSQGKNSQTHSQARSPENSEVLSRVPDADDELLTMLGESLVACGRAEEAREWLAASATFGADEVTLRLAGWLHEHGDTEGALAAMTAAPPAATGESERLLGTLLAGTGELEAAKAAFERAAAIDPASEPETMLAAGRCLTVAGDAEAARFALERAAAREDGAHSSAVSRHLLGRATEEELPWVLAAEGDREGALAALTGRTGSALVAAVLLALDADDLPGLRRALSAPEPESAPEHASATARADRVPATAAPDHPPAPAGQEGVFAAEGLPGAATEDRERAFREVLARARQLEGDAAEPLLRIVAELGEPGIAAEARVELGAVLSNEGDHSRAELCLLPATEVPETAGTAWHYLAVVRHRRGDLDGAIEAAITALPATAALAAELLAERGDTAEVRRVLAGGAAAGDLECVRRLLVHLLQEEDHDAVAAEAERAVATGDPETVAMAYWTWGDACKARGDLEQAALLYAKGVDTGFPGTTPSMRVDLARALRERGDTEEAGREVRLAVESGDRDGVARGGVQLGVWLHEEGDQLGAARAFAAAAGTGTDLARTALSNLEALAYQACRRGEHDVAVEVLELMGPRAAEQARELGDLCEDPAAVRRYHELAGPGPFTDLRVGERLESLGETAQARAIYERLNEHENPDVRFVAGGRLLSLLDAEGDSEAFYNLAERQAGDADSPVQGVFGSLLGMLQERQGDTEASLRTLRAAAESGEPTALSVFAQALVGAGEVEEGRQVYLRVLDAGDGDLAVRAMIAIGQTYHDEDEELASGWYRRAVEDGAGHAGALAAMYLGALAKRRRDYPEALTWYQRVIDAGDPESGMAAAHLGELCYWLGDRDGALRYYELTLGLSEQPELVAEAACRLGEIRYERGDLELARRLLATAVETADPSFAPEAEALLGKLR